MVHWPRAAIAFLWLFSPAVAQVTDSTWDPPVPVMGDAVTYTVVPQNNPNPWPVASYAWHWKYQSAVCPDLPWVGGQGGTEFMSYEPRPGTWTVRLTVTYQSPGQDPVTGMMLPPPPPNEIPKQVTIAPATRVVIVAGAGERANGVNGKVIFRFRVDGASGACGPFLGMASLAQEKLTDRVFIVPPFQFPWLPDTGWIPPSFTPEFQLSGNEIIDHHTGSGTQQEWDSIPVGAEFLSATQLLRLKYTDPCGTVQVIPLGSISHSRVKINANEWQAVAALVP